LVYQGTKAVWIPAFAGMTMVGSKRLHQKKSEMASPTKIVRILDGIHDLK
jgi:hypothetical protein